MITSAGKSWDVQAEPGDNLMKVGIKAGVPYEVACGGNAECCTCHVYLPKSVIEAEDYIKPDDQERDALDWAHGTSEESRLACQTKVTAAMEG